MYRFASASALLALLLLPMTGGATVTKSFSLTATLATVAGSYGAQFDGTVATGFFSYDDAELDAGFDQLDSQAGLAVEMTIFSQTFLALNDVDYDLFPVVTFYDYEATTLAFLLEEGINGVDFSPPHVVRVASLELVPGTGGFDYVGPLYIDAVPAPTTAALFAIGLAGFFFNKAAANSPRNNYPSRDALLRKPGSVDCEPGFT